MKTGSFAPGILALVLTLAAAGLTLGAAGQARAQEPTDPTEGALAPAGVAAPLTTPDPATADLSTTARARNAVAYGVAARTRWVSVPGWFLGLFLEENVPLSSYGVGAEFFRRKRDKDDENAFFDIALGFAYQKMGPPDGNWLGKGKDASLDTDLVQFRNLGFVGVDASFLWRQHLTPHIGLHYGAGVGLAFVTGKMLRTSNSGCTKANAGDERQCRPRVCPAEGCNEAVLRATEGEKDRGPTDPHRFADQNVPGAIPILNFLFGVNFRIPEARGLDLRLEAGFYDAFFAGLGVGYLF